MIAPIRLASGFFWNSRSIRPSVQTTIRVMLEIFSISSLTWSEITWSYQSRFLGPGGLGPVAGPFLSLGGRTTA
jgi:hypothetical protein